MQTNPEQWAVELFKRLEKMVFQSPAGTCLDGEAIYVIQAAFAEREARLRQALEAVEAAMIRGGDGRVLSTGWDITCLNRARPLILAALKDRTHG